LNETTNILNDITIDFDSNNDKRQLISVFEQIENTNLPIMDDDYSVKVKLKDESTLHILPDGLYITKTANKRDNI